LKFLAGLILGILVVPAILYIYFASGMAPVATTDPEMPFETYFARKAQNVRIAKDMPKSVPIQPSEANYMAGAELYKQHCAVCHGLPDSQKTAIATGMFPHPPQLFQGKGVTDDEPGETYWKIFNGFRLTGMPGFSKSLNQTQMWQMARRTTARSRAWPMAARQPVDQRLMAGQQAADRRPMADRQPVEKQAGWRAVGSATGGKCHWWCRSAAGGPAGSPAGCSAGQGQSQCEENSFPFAFAVEVFAADAAGGFF